jgi:hypothetical protein
MTEYKRLKHELWIKVFCAEIERSGIVEHAEWKADKAVEIYEQRSF